MLDSINPAGDVGEHDPNAGDLDFKTLYPNAGGVRVIEVVDAGTTGVLVLRMAGSSANRTLTGLTAGWVSVPGNFVSTESTGTTVTKIRVWV